MNVYLTYLSIVPGMPPKTDIGSFESLPRAHDPDHRIIYVYWQQIPQWQENGENFGYNISSIEEIVNGQPILRNETPEIDRTRATFERMSYNAYIFKIVSFNKEGRSKDYSTILVPSKAKSKYLTISSILPLISQNKIFSYKNCIMF